MQKEPSRIVIADSSPLILLAKIERLDILSSLYDEIYIPEAVHNEINAIQDKVSEIVNSTPFIIRQSIVNTELLNGFPKTLHNGEIEAMVLYQERNADLLIMDDKRAVSEARRRGQNVVGLLGVIVKAKQEGIVDSIRQILNDLTLKHNYYISDDLVEGICKEFGE